MSDDEGSGKFPPESFHSQETMVVVEPRSVKKTAEFLRDVGYGGESAGKFAVYILIPLDFLESENRRLMIEGFVTFFKENDRHKPNKYNCDMSDQDFVSRSHSIYKAGRTGADIDRYYAHSATVSGNAPHINIWLYHTYVSFSGDSIYYNDDMQKNVETRFLKKLEDWRIPLNAGIGMTEMTFGCSLESPSPDSLQYLVHSSVLDEVYEQATNNLATDNPGPTFTWKKNGTDIGRGRASRYNSGTGFQVGQTFNFLATQDDNGERHPNAALVFIIKNAERHLNAYNYEMMYAWLEHLDIKLQHYPDYQFENEKRRVREYAIERTLKKYENEKERKERQKEILTLACDENYPVVFNKKEIRILRDLEVMKAPSRRENANYARLHQVAARALKKKDDRINELEAENMELKERVAELEKERRARDRKSPKPQQELTKEINNIRF